MSLHPASENRIPTARLISQCRSELFDLVLPFWDRHGVDHEHGGFLCALDTHGGVLSTQKHHWFQGRGLWVYSYLFHRFGQNPVHLETARRARDFLLRHFPAPGGGWNEVVSGDGRVLRAFDHDYYGMLFAVEGLYEYALASGDAESRDTAIALFSRLLQEIESPGFRDRQGGARGIRTQGLWMMLLRIATQILRQENLEIARTAADQALDLILNRHFNTELGLNNEKLRFDFSRPSGEEMKCVFGHSIECLWMVMDEAMRRGDRGMMHTAARRLRRHLDTGWDHLWGGLMDALYAGQSRYEWPPAEIEGHTGEFHSIGEYRDIKTYWSLNEVLIAALLAWEHTGEEWAAHYFDLALDLADHRFSLKRHGLGSHFLVLDRRMRAPEPGRPCGSRQDNYHPPRRLMLNIETLERLKAASASAT